MVPNPKKLVHSRAVPHHQIPNRSFSTEIRQISASSSHERVWFTFAILSIVGPNFLCVLSAAVYISPLWALFIIYQSHVSSNFSFPPTETRFWKHSKDIQHMQVEINLGINFTHGFIRAQWDPRDKRGLLPTAPGLFFLVVLQSKLSRKMIYRQ